MAATTSQNIRQPSGPDGTAPVQAFTQKAGTLIPAGTLCSAISGVCQPAVASEASQVLLGIAEQTYDATAEGSNVTYTVPMVFRRGPFALPVKSGDEPTDANLLGNVYVSHNNEIKATSSTNTPTVKYLGRAGTRYLFEVAK